MKIEKVKEEMKVEKFPIPNIMRTIFAICKTDKTFLLKSETEDVEQKIKILEEKVSKKNNLLQRSEEIKNDLEKRINILSDYVSELRSDLLEALGSEL